MILVFSSCVILTIIQFKLFGLSFWMLPVIATRLLYALRPLGFEKPFKVYCIGECVGVCLTGAASLFSHRYSFLDIFFISLFCGSILLIEYVDYRNYCYPVEVEENIQEKEKE